MKTKHNPHLLAAALMSALAFTTTPLRAQVEHVTLGSHVSQEASAESGGDKAAEVAKKLANPIASMVSVPFQSNFDWGSGPTGDGFKYTLNFQPVIPFSLNDDWNLITRTIVPFVTQDDVIGKSSQTGLSDTSLSLWLSPNKVENGWTWGVGPVFLIPTATDDLLGTEKLGIGPTVVLLKQDGPWTYGALLNHIWDVAGDSDRSAVNATFLEPFLSYTTKTHYTFTIQTETTYDWEHQQWNVPINLLASKVVKIGGQHYSFQVGARYHADGPDDHATWGARFNITLALPK